MEFLARTQPYRQLMIVILTEVYLCTVCMYEMYTYAVYAMCAICTVYPTNSMHPCTSGALIIYSHTLLLEYTWPLTQRYTLAFDASCTINPAFTATTYPTCC